MPETYELLRLVEFLINLLEEVRRPILLPIEAKILLEAIERGLQADFDCLTLWDHLSSAVEAYRASTRLGFEGRKISVDMAQMLLEMHASLKSGIAQAQNFTGDIPPTYFIHEATDYNLTGEEDQDGNPYIEVTHFKPQVLPLFLEGPVRWMKINDLNQVQQLHQAIKGSPLYDQKLGMFKVNAPLAGESHEIGRARAFTPGWLENESIWMHMAFKYLLELQKAGLHEDFFEDLQRHLPAFMDQASYGRSLLENSSFIVSSVHPDPALHGVGFVARLSGSTAEFLSMWVHMTAGPQPFRLEEGQLTLALKPALPGWLFKADGSFTFRFLGSCDVTYHNPDRLNTYAEGVTINAMELHGKGETLRIEGAEIKGALADRVRKGEFTHMDCYLRL
jgi:hypothetical protein